MFDFLNKKYVLCNLFGKRLKLKIKCQEFVR